ATSRADRIGDLSDLQLTGKVTGPCPTITTPDCLANILTKELDHTVSANEPYFFPACNSTDASSPTGCVFPGAVIPQSVWSEPAKHLLQYIPAPNSGESTFSSGSENKIVRYDKWSFPTASNHARWAP